MGVAASAGLLAHHRAAELRFALRWKAYAFADRAELDLGGSGIAPAVDRDRYRIA
jgi:hypothetical protein